MSDSIPIGSLLYGTPSHMNVEVEFKEEPFHDHPDELSPDLDAIIWVQHLYPSRAAAAAINLN